MPKDSLSVNGRFTLEHRDSNGELKERREFSNLVVNDGLARMAALFLSDISGTAFDYIAIGSGSTAPTASDSSLGTEVDRAAATGTQQTTNVTNDTAQLENQFSFSSSNTISEAGVFDSSTGGTMAARQTFSDINVSDGDTLTVTYQITFS